LTLEAAERHYGSIVAVAQAGAICGSTMSVLGSRKSNDVMIDGEGRVDASIDSMAESDSQVTPMLIFLACGCIAAGMGIMAVYGHLFSKPMAQDTHESDATAVKSSSMADICKSDQQQQPSSKEVESDGVCQDLLSGLYLIFRYEYLKLVLAVSVLYEIALTCMHYEMNLIGLDRFGVGVSIQDESTLNDSSSKHEGITYIQFMGWYGQTVNILSLFLSYYAFPRLIKHYGLSTTIRIFPTFLLVVTICAFVIFPHNLPFLFIALSVCKALTYSVHDPSEEVLYMPTSDAVKFKAKFWIDVVGQRVAKALGSGINNFAGSIEGIVKYGSLPSIVASIALWLACYQVGVLFDQLIKSGDVVGLEDTEEDLGLELQEGIETYSHDGDEDNDSPLFREVEENIPPPSLGGEMR
jgi:ATP/ADP translocase